MKQIVQNLSKDLQIWAKACQPIAKGDFVPLARMDKSCTRKSLEDLFFEVGHPEDVSASGKTDLTLLRRQLISTGSLRNSFFPDVFRKHTKFEYIRLSLELSGSFDLQVSQARLNITPEALYDDRILSVSGKDGASIGRQTINLPFSLESDISTGARLFWTLRAQSDGAQIHDAVWQGLAPQDSAARMIVVLRTFGRTNDIKGLLTAFNKEAKYSSHYARILKNVFFYVLDTTNGVSVDDYAEIGALEHVSAHVIKGANLGGGGNMSQALLLLHDAIASAKLSVGELLLLDDDLTLSLESLCRHWASTVFRSDNTVFTLPVFMKSEPRKMWEDGALWGRFLDENMTGDRSAIAPKLLRHNREFKQYAFLDEMAKAHYPEYCTFIFFSLPYQRFLDLGYPAAFFLRGDDIEYSLRHRKAGGQTMSNPNLCAWHEPAHSFGQEYMSISHGVIINMRYGNEKPDAFAKFFARRLTAHASIGDALGLQLYAEILRDLNSKAMFLEHDFAKRYVAKLGLFRSFDQQFEYISNELREDLRNNAQARNVFMGEYGFLYPPIEGNPTLARVILENPHTGNFRLYDPTDVNTITACIRASDELTTELARFIEDYDSLRKHYSARFDAVSEAPFWQKELTYHNAPECLLGLTE